MSDRRINVLVDAHCFDREYQGSRTFIKEIYSALASEKKIKIHIAAYNTERLKSEFPQADIQLIKYRSRSPFFRLLFDISSIISKYSIDYAHLQYFMPFYKNCKTIVTIHDVLFLEQPSDFPFLYRWIRKHLCRMACKRADLVTTVSEYSRKSIVKHLHANDQNVHVIPGGVASRFFISASKAESKSKIFSLRGFDRYILFISRVEPRKNHVALIQAYLDLELYNRGYHLVMAGHTSLPVPELSRQMKKIPASIQPWIHFLTDVDDDELPHLYRAADLFVYPSKAEGFGLPPLEAAAMQTPVICSNTTAMADYRFFRLNHISPANRNLLKERIQAVLVKNERPEPIHIQNQVKAHYSWKNSAEKLLTLITKESIGRRNNKIQTQKKSLLQSEL